MLSPTVLKVLHCTDDIPPCTEYPPQYWRYPPLYWSYSPLYWATSTVLKVSRTVLKLSPTCTAVMPLTVLKVPSTVLNTLHSTDVFPQYWCYPLHVLRLSPTVLKLTPTVLSKLYSTEAIPHSTDVISPMYWTTSNVLKASTVLNWRYMGWNLNSKLNLSQWILICCGEF